MDGLELHLIVHLLPLGLWNHCIPHQFLLVSEVQILLGQFEVVGPQERLQFISTRFQELRSVVTDLTLSRLLLLQEASHVSFVAGRGPSFLIQNLVLAHAHAGRDLFLGLVLPQQPESFFNRLIFLWSELLGVHFDVVDRANQLLREFLVEFRLFHLQVSIDEVISDPKRSRNSMVACPDVIFTIVSEIVLVLDLVVVALEIHSKVGSEASVVERDVPVSSRAVLSVEHLLCALVQFEFILLVLAHSSVAHVSSMVVEGKPSKVIDLLVDV